MARRRKKCPHNIAWLRLQNGTLRVDLETSEVFSLFNGEWKSLVFRETTPQSGGHSGGYLYTKIGMTVDGEYWRQSVFLHRVVYMAAHGVELQPTDEIDHLDADQRNCHWENLELVSGDENKLRRDRRARLLDKLQAAEQGQEEIPF
jgi:hypothetical protein